jgi:hypothetical protein
MDNLHIPDIDDSASFVSLPRYSMVETLPIEDFDIGTISNILSSGIPEHPNITGLPRYSTHWPSSTSPRYTTVFGPQEGSSSLSSAGSVPLTPGKKEHEFYLRNGKKPWATLSVLSSAPSSTNAPKFYSGDDIAGSLSLDLDSSQYFQAIKLSASHIMCTARI